MAKRTQSDKVLRDKAFEIASNLKYDGYQRGFSLIEVVLKMKLNKMNNLQINITNQLLENLKRRIVY